MAVARNKMEVSADKLLEVARQLSPPDLKELINELQVIQARHEEENALLAKINNSGLSTERQRRNKELRKKLRAERITDEEHKELLGLSDEMEAKRVEWLEALVELARLRNLSLRELMNALGIKPPPVE